MCLMNEGSAIINIKVTYELLLLFGIAWKSDILKYNVKILKRNENEENQKALIMVAANTRLSTNNEQCEWKNLFMNRAKNVLIFLILNLSDQLFLNIFHKIINNDNILMKWFTIHFHSYSLVSCGQCLSHLVDF